MKSVSINKKAEKICGRRDDGNSLFFPIELGYYCPICKSEIEKSLDDMNESKMLRWSEYEYFLWCPNCNIDIPSILCKFRREPNIITELLDEKTRVLFQTEIFLDIMKEHHKKNCGEK